MSRSFVWEGLVACSAQWPPLLGCMAQNGQQPGPFFLVPGCRHIIQRETTVQRLVGLELPWGQRIWAHSTQLWSSGSGSRAEMEDSLIRTLGCWHFAASRRCIRAPAQLLASMAMQLLRQNDDGQCHCWSVGRECLHCQWAVVSGWTRTKCRLY